MLGIPYLGYAAWDLNFSFIESALNGIIQLVALAIGLSVLPACTVSVKDQLTRISRQDGRRV